MAHVQFGECVVCGCCGVLQRGGKSLACDFFASEEGEGVYVGEVGEEEGDGLISDAGEAEVERGE